MRTNRNSRLGPLATDRLHALLGARGWPRAIALRRLIALALVALAGVLALRTAGADGTADAHVVVAGRDLPPGITLTAADVSTRPVPADTVPRGALTSTAAVVGRVLAGGVRAGESLTDVRLVGQADTMLSTGDPDAAAVPVRLADPDVAELLRPGIRVDVVTLDPERQSDPVVAANAVVLTVRAAASEAFPGQRQGRLVVIALPRHAATQVAAASLKQPMTVTLR
jgi:Flp pilus assembly protein CpaB